MPFNIEHFRSHIKDWGYLDTNRFEVQMTSPYILRSHNASGEIGRLLKNRVESLIAPGISLITTDVPRYGVGTTQKYPITAQFNDISFNVLSDGYGIVWDYFHQWARHTFEFCGLDQRTYTSARYNAFYKDDYSTDMYIIIYDKFGQIQQRIHLHNAYPTMVRDMQFDWNTQNDLLKMLVNITYKEYTIQRADKTRS